MSARPGGGDPSVYGGGDPPRCDVPNDVLAWVRETYKPAGVAIWVRAWEKADGNQRASMVAAARLVDGGS